MKKLILSAAAVCFLAACATDPYTGESKVSKTAWGTGIGTLAGAGIGAVSYTHLTLPTNSLV